MAGLIYVGLFVFSCVFTLAAFLFGGGGDSDVDADADLDVDVDADIGEGLPGFFSTRVVSLFVVGFSSMGIVAHYVWQLPPYYSSLCGLGAGVLMGALAYGLIVLLYRQQATSTPTRADYRGLKGRVTIAIPKGGTGEVSVALKGQLRGLMAVAADREPIAEGRPVEVLDLTGGTATVKELQ